MTVDYQRIIKLKYPGKVLVEYDGDSYESIVWNNADGTPAPSKTELDNLIALETMQEASPILNQVDFLDTLIDALPTTQYWIPIWNSSAITVLGIASPSTTGTPVARSIGSTGVFASAKRVAYTSASSKGSSCGIRLATQQYWRGNAPGAGGFHMTLRFGIGDPFSVPDTSRMFVGLTGASAIGNVNPSSLTNIFGVGCEAGDTTFSLMYNDASGTATKIDLGANFPCNTRLTDLYELHLQSVAGTSTIGWKLTRLNTGDVISGACDTNIPAQNQMLAPQWWRNNGTDAIVVGIDFAGFIALTEN